MGAIRNAQKQGLVCCVIAIEPSFNDPEWMMKHGVDPEQLLVLRPESGEEAVQMALKVARTGDCDVLVFDSVGALLNESEREDDGKVKAGGQSPLITRLVKNLAPAAYRYNICVLLLNQIRANFNSPVPGSVKYPGGYALEHLSEVHVRLRYGKNGKKGFSIKEHGEDVTIGRQIVALIERNKSNEGSNQKATFDFYIKDTGGEYPFGVDLVNDVVNTAKRVGVIKQHGPYFEIPGHDGKIQGVKAVGEILKENPKTYDLIRSQVLEVMA
jgi:recombination protein RecA